MAQYIRAVVGSRFEERSASRADHTYMKRFLTTLVPTLCGLVALMGSAQEAEAADMKGRIGVGGMRALAGYSALHVKYFVASKWSITGGLGLSHYNLRGDGDWIVDFILAPGFSYWITPQGQTGPLTASFGIGGRLGINIGGTSDDDSSWSGISTEAVGTAEIFFGQHFSLAPEGGIVFRFFNGRSDEFAGDVDGIGFELGRNTGLFGGGSFNFYF